MSFDVRPASNWTPASLLGLQDEEEETSFLSQQNTVNKMKGCQSELNINLNLICCLHFKPVSTCIFTNSALWAEFHQLGPLGRVGLVVDMSVCLSVCPLFM